MTWRLISLLLAVLCPGLGCYYGHLASGQARVLWARQSVDEVIADTHTDPALRERLLLVQDARRFAAELGLDVGGQYTSYVPWPGDRLVTSLIVTEPGSIEARPFSFPIVGAVPYKGYFDQARAERDAQDWQAKGFNTCLLPIPAYSTLGFFDDPVTDPMLRAGHGRVVETVIHELVHATVFIKSEPDLNEGAANFIGEEASVRFFADDPEKATRRRAEVDDDRLLAATLMAVRNDIAALYEERLEPTAQDVRRAQLEASARERIAALPLTTRDPERLAARVRMDDPCLALRGAYVADTPKHVALLEALDGDLNAFVDRFEAVSDADDPRAAFFGEFGEVDPGAGGDPD